MQIVFSAIMVKTKYGVATLLSNLPTGITVLNILK